MSQERKCNRRRFWGMAAMSIVSAGLCMIGSANAQSTEAKPAECLTLSQVRIRHLLHRSRSRQAF